MQWRLANDLELVFVVVYQNILQLAYVDALLDEVRDKFVEQFQVRFGVVATSCSSLL